VKKYLIRLETCVGGETYRLAIESENPPYASSCGRYYVKNAQLTQIDIRQTNDSLTFGPFKKNVVYSELSFPIINTIMSEQVIEYGDAENK